MFTRAYFESLDSIFQWHFDHWVSGQLYVQVVTHTAEYLMLAPPAHLDDGVVTFMYFDEDKSLNLPQRARNAFGKKAFPLVSLPYGEITAVYFLPKLPADGPTADDMVGFRFENPAHDSLEPSTKDEPEGADAHAETSEKVAALQP